MATILDYPVVLAVLSFLALSVSARVGAMFFRTKPLPEELREGFGVVKAATLTLLGLIIGLQLFDGGEPL